MEAVINELAKVLKATYVDPKPENGELTDKFFRDRAAAFASQHPKRVVPIIQAFENISKEFYYFDKNFE